MKKRGQVTIFIIIAIVIIALVVLFFTFKDKLGIFTPESNPVYLFTKGCVEETGKDAILYVTSNGGYVSPPELSTTEGIPYYFYNNRSYTPTKEMVEQRISSYIEQTLSYCTDGFSNFTGLNITEGEIKTRTTINEGEIVLNVKYPINIEKEGSVTRFENFNNIKIKSRVKLMYDSIKEIEENSKEGICLSCISSLADENGFTIGMTNTEEGIVFTLRDEHSKIKDSPVEWKFANKY
ncbi:MAG: hypothetical protein Q7S06_02920 [Nanoarchaeota archaeon]|nr:hypothetical protein [Nanoarchaeota archaeon]